MGWPDKVRPLRGPRTVTPALFLGVLLIPPIFVWFLLRPGHSTRSQILGVAWLGVLGLALLVGAPNGLLIKAKPVPSASAPRAWEATARQGGGPLTIDFKLDQTRAVYQLLRTAVTLKNNVGRDLRYVEVFCSYYDAAGVLLGYGMSNWATVKAGETVTGEVVASGVVIDDVRRRDCRARHL